MDVYKINQVAERVVALSYLLNWGSIVYCIQFNKSQVLYLKNWKKPVLLTLEVLKYLQSERYIFYV